MSKTPAKKYRVMADSKGGLPLPPALARKLKVKIGDKFAAWKEGNDIIVVFTGKNRRKREIPKGAYRGKVERSLPETREAEFAGAKETPGQWLIRNAKRPAGRKPDARFSAAWCRRHRQDSPLSKPPIKKPRQKK